MFWKLLKYEFKNVNKWYLGLYLGIFTLSILLGFWIRGGFESSGFWSGLLSETSGNIVDYPTSPYSSSMLEILGMTVFMTFFGLMIALGISTLFLIIRRFKNSIYDREGYLTLTLPVSKHEILLSKLLAALIWSGLSLLTLLISVLMISLIVGLGHIDWNQFNLHGTDWIDLMQGLLYAIVSITSSILLIYLAISIGQLFNDNRTIFAFVAYFGISILSSLVVLTVSTNLNLGEENFLISSTVYDLIEIVLFYSGTYYILKNKVNLQ